MGGSQHNLYIHEPFKDNLKLRPIRLCRLAPALSSDEEIRCELFNTNLDAKEDFEALSYTWGNPKDIWPIILHDKPFYVTQNLAVAFKNLRSVDRERVLWIDALCINQFDVLEKNQQVPLMKDIYSPGGARQVIVWLGEITNARRAIDFCNQMNVCIRTESEWIIKCQKRRDVRARYAGKSLREQPYDDEAAYHAAKRLWEHMEANERTRDILAYFQEQAYIHKCGMDDARNMLIQIQERKNSEFPVAYCLEQYHVQRTASEAARLLWNRMQDPNRNEDRDPLQ